MILAWYVVTLTNLVLEDFDLNYRILTIAVLTLFVAAGAREAQSATINFAPGAWFSVDGSYKTGNIDLYSAPLSTSEYSTQDVGQAQLTLSNAIITDSNLYSWGAVPKSVTGDQHFIVVMEGGYADFDLTSKANYFSFNWGSLDSFNYVSYTNGNNDWYSISGKDLVEFFHIANYMDDFYFELFDAAGIKEIVLSSECVGMEIANVSTSQVPLPPAFAMFGMALVGIAGLRSRNKKAA